MMQTDIRPMSVNGIEITQDTIMRTRQHFAAISIDCADEVRSGRRQVNNPSSYIAWREQAAADSLAGKYDGNLTFMQQALYIQTGDCLALLA